MGRAKFTAYMSAAVAAGMAFCQSGTLETVQGWLLAVAP